MHEADKVLSVKFFLHHKENPRKSKEAGRPIFDQVEMVSIMAPGNRKTEFTAPADEVHFNGNEKRQMTYAERFAEQYDAFKRGVEEQLVGTPLSEAPFLRAQPALRAEMEAAKIFTVESLAGMSDTNIRKMGMGFRKHVDEAKKYLETSSSNATMQAELEKLRKQVADLQGTPTAKADDTTEPDVFDLMEPEDLRAMLTDAGEEVDGRWGAEKLRAKAREISAEAEEAA